MQRFTISLDDALAVQFDALIVSRGYSNRSEAVRDLLRTQIDQAHLQAAAALWCVATVNYVYNHHDAVVAQRVLSLQHEHHDLVITSLHVHLDHTDCLETVVLRGPIKEVNPLCQLLVALRGVRHGTIHLVPLDQDTHAHKHEHGSKTAHVHLKPIS
jgi:CopG family transcriptional regulator, nickel-responsive regulator